MRSRTCPILFATAILVFRSLAWAQVVEPKRPAPPPSYAPNGAVKWPEFIPRPAPVASMKLLAPNVGWALSMRRLLWTDNGGTSWKDITPPGSKDAAISAIFFLDTSRGWVLLAHGEPDLPGGTTFDLAATDDAGASWSKRRVRIPQRQYSESDLFTGGILAFADPLHGWLALRAGISAAFEGTGLLLVTSDGGATWKLGTAEGWKKYGVIGPMLMVTHQYGWLVGGGANSPLRVTRDGGRTWQTVEIESPVETDQMREYDRRSAAFWTSFQKSNSPQAKERATKALSQRQTYAAYDLPVFKDSKRGYISVTYPGVVVLFATNDGGITWKPDRILTGLPEHSMGTKVASAIADSTWIIGTAPGKEMPHLRKFESGANVTDAAMPAPEASGVLQMSFVASSQGWVLTSDTKLLSTRDGGTTWTDISPPR
jgi:photosystem II stability/assembly factor-like uncharacterized protein